MFTSIDEIVWVLKLKACEMKAAGNLDISSSLYNIILPIPLATVSAALLSKYLLRLVISPIFSDCFLNAALSSLPYLLNSEACPFHMLTFPKSKCILQ